MREPKGELTPIYNSYEDKNLYAMFIDEDSKVWVRTKACITCEKSNYTQVHSALGHGLGLVRSEKRISTKVCGTCDQKLRSCASIINKVL